MPISRRLALVAFAFAGLATACGESSYDIYMRGLEAAGRADRNECRLVFDKAEQTHVINSHKIAQCLEANEAALTIMKEGRDAGFTGKDVDDAIAKREGQIERLQSMRRTVAYMERDQALGDHNE